MGGGTARPLRSLCLALAFLASPLSPGTPLPPSADQEVLRWLERHRFPELCRKGFLARAKANGAGPERQPFLDCISQRLTSEAFRPLLGPLLFRYLTLEQLREINDFMDAPAGRTFLDWLVDGAQAPGPKVSREEARKIDAAIGTPAFQAYLKFHKEAMPRISEEPEFQRILNDLIQGCKDQLPAPHPPAPR